MTSAQAVLCKYDTHVCVACAVYGTAVVHRVSAGCWSGSEASSVVRVTQGMIYSTWAFTALLM